jgi:acetyl esterase/lipase
VLLLVLATLACARAARSECLPLVPRNPDGNYIVPGVLGDVVYGNGSGRELALDAFVQQGAAPRPLVVVVHGGGWISGSRVAFVGQLLEMLTRGGFNWVSVDYRLGPGSSSRDAVDDVAEALAFVRCHANALRADPNRLVLLGEDTGAEIVALLAAQRPPGVKAAVLLGGSYDQSLPSTPPSPTAGRESTSSLLVHGSEDSDVSLEKAAARCEAAKARGDACRLLRVEGASHRPENWWPAQWGYKERVLEWLEQTVGAPGAYVPAKARLQKLVVFDEKESLHLDAWVPETAGPHPALILAHGGGWEAGDRVTYITPLFEPLARAGFAWFSIDYRLTPKVRHPAQLDDLRRAIDWVRSNARRLNVDPARIALLGESASGQMAVQVAEGDSRLQGVVSFYGVYDFLPLVKDASPRSLLTRLFGRTQLDDDARDQLRQFSPIYHVQTGMPPVLLVHGTSEELWAQGLAMAAALQAKGIDHELVRLEGAPHGMENWEGRPEWLGYKDRVVAWLRALPPRRQ